MCLIITIHLQDYMLCQLESKLRITLCMNKLQFDFAHNPKSFWKYINNLKKDNGILAVMEFNNFSRSSDHEIADSFNAFFLAQSLLIVF